MKKYIILIAVALISTGLFAGAAKLSWVTSLEEAKKIAKKERKSIVTIYYIDKDEKNAVPFGVIEKDPAVADRYKDLIFVKVEDSLKPRFKEYPVMQFLYPSGNEFLLKRLSGTFRKTQVQNNILDILYDTTEVINAKLDAFVTGTSKTYPAGVKIRIRYKVLERALCVIRIFDESGKLIKKIEQSVKKPDSYFAEWDQSDTSGAKVKTGKYLISFELGSYKDLLEFSIL